MEDPSLNLALRIIYINYGDYKDRETSVRYVIS